MAVLVVPWSPIGHKSDVCVGMGVIPATSSHRSWDCLCRSEAMAVRTVTAHITNTWKSEALKKQFTHFQMLHFLTCDLTACKLCFRWCAYKIQRISPKKKTHCAFMTLIVLSDLPYCFRIFINKLRSTIQQLAWLTNSFGIMRELSTVIKLHSHSIGNRLHLSKVFT